MGEMPGVFEQDGGTERDAGEQIERKYFGEAEQVTPPEGARVRRLVMDLLAVTQRCHDQQEKWERRGESGS